MPSLMHVAVRTNDISTFKEYLLHDNNLKDSQAEDGTSILMYAIECNKIEIVKLLLESGADVNEPNFAGHTALMIACNKENYNIVKLLVESDANINLANGNGNTALIFASRKQHLEIVKLLVESGADVNLPNNEKNTPLIIASSKSNFELVKLLVEANANVNYTNLESDRAFLYNLDNDHFNITEYLYNNGADCNGIWKYGNVETGQFIELTFLMIAVGLNNLNFTDLLLEKGVNIQHEINSTNILQYVGQKIQNYKEEILSEDDDEIIEQFNLKIQNLNLFIEKIVSHAIKISANDYEIISWLMIQLQDIKTDDNIEMIKQLEIDILKNTGLQDFIYKIIQNNCNDHQLLIRLCPRKCVNSK